MKYEDIEADFNKFFEFPGADRSTVTSVSAKLFAMYIANQIEERAGKLRAAICQTLDDNNHLADGEDCTLHALKVALRENGTPWAGDMRADLDALKDNAPTVTKKSTLSGFGVMITGGSARSWYVGKDGVKRWTDNNDACGESTPSNYFIYKE